jgi:hypothetical protein
MIYNKVTTNTHPTVFGSRPDYIAIDDVDEIVDDITTLLMDKLKEIYWSGADTDEALMEIQNYLA